MKDILLFLGRGLALFAGEPTMLSEFPAFSCSATVVIAQRHV